MKVSIGVSNRHVHLTKEHLKALEKLNKEKQKGEKQMRNARSLAAVHTIYTNKMCTSFSCQK